MKKEELVYLLGNQDFVRWGIQGVRKSLLRHIREERNKDETIRQLSLPGQGENTYAGRDTVPLIVEHYQEMRKAQLDELQKELNKIAQEEACINLVFKCLYSMKEPYRSILLLLYVEKEKWEVIRERLHIGNDRLTKLRRISLNKLLKKYNDLAQDLEKKGEILIFDSEERTVIEIKELEGIKGQMT